MEQPKIHLAVPDKDNQLVPQCDGGYEAWKSCDFVVMNTLPGEVTCGHCCANMLREKLKTIKVLWRQPDLLTLWGLPYLLREGQSPYDLWKAHRDWEPPKPFHYGSKRIDISDWVYLGQPGWYGSMSKEEVTLVKAFVEKLGNQVPGGHCEWSVIE